MPHLEVFSPQPARCLKRKVSQLNTTFDEGYSNKRSHCGFSLPSTIGNWLVDLPPPISRCRSDSFLLTQIRGPRVVPYSNMPRPKVSQLPTMRRPPTPQSSSSGPQLVAPGTLPALYDQDTQCPYTPAQSFAASSIVELAEDEWRAAGRTASPGYRDTLRNHGVFIDVYGGLKVAPDQVKAAATLVLEKKRITPEPSAKDLSRMQTKIARAIEKDEGGTRDAFVSAQLFEIPEKHVFTIADGSSVPFDRNGLPHTHGFNLTPIAAPKPDLQFGFPHTEFAASQIGVMNNHRISPYAKPSTATYWPFFVVELKAASRGGTHFIGENQAAGAGAHCVKSVDTLFEHTHRERSKEKAFDSMMFSCVADAQHGTLWVHWRGIEVGKQPRYNSAELRDFVWKHDSAEILNFRRTVRNIIDYGVDTRLPEIKEALDTLVQRISVWKAEDKQARSRALDNESEAGESQTKRTKAM